MSLVQGYESSSGESDAEAAEVNKKRTSINPKFERQEQNVGIKNKRPKIDSEHRIDTDLDLGGDEDSEQSLSVEESKFWGKKPADYQGRSFIHPPVDVSIDLHKEALSFKCFLPKQKYQEYAGHKKGTTSLEFFPITGHLLLSGGNDKVIKIWDFYHDKELLRTYEGHSMTIKDTSFTKDGGSFASASFDKWVKIWHTEDGNVSKRIAFKSVPNCVAFHPSDPQQFVVGLANSEIKHYDLRVAEKAGLVQTYDHHQGSILALKFFPDGSKLISSSEDKTVRIWDNQVNIPIKQISGTSQHSMPWIDISPQGQYFCTQSMDNTIYTYSMVPKYKRHPSKMFKGHSTTGYGIQFTFSPDGQYIASGDSKGKVFVWDWKTNRVLKTYTPFSNKLPVTCIAWNPQETSKLCCSGFDGKIAVYD